MATPTPIPHPHPNGPLTGYRVLDLADEKGQLCARLMAELGADVIKVEPRAGDRTRENGPYFKDEAGPNTSLYWWAMNAGKRSVTCELRLQPGRDLLHRLVEHADVVIETETPGTQAAQGLDYETLKGVNPGVVVVSISPWGQTGPYVERGYRTSDIVASAMGGHMHLNGDPERGPVRTTVPQAFAQANFQGSVGAMIALYARGAVLDGAGQHVDVSMQEAMANAMDHAQQTWDIRHANISGPGLYRNRGGIVLGRYLYEASDGWVACLANGGLATPRGGAIIDWLAEHGAAGELTKDEWREKLLTQQPLTDEERAHIEEVLVGFCKKHTREWLVQEAQSRGAGWAPVFSPREIVESNQLAARDYWVSVHHEDLGESFVYPGAPWKLSETPWLQRGRAPSPGEHNQEVYGELLGLDDAELRRLKMRMVV